MTVEIHARDIVTFANGSKIARVTKPGTMKLPSKTGPADHAYHVGDLVLVDIRGLVLVTPLSFAGATDIARAVIENHPGTVTDSHSLRALATAVIGFAARVTPPETTPLTAEECA